MTYFLRGFFAAGGFPEEDSFAADGDEEEARVASSAEVVDGETRGSSDLGAEDEADGSEVGLVDAFGAMSGHFEGAGSTGANVGVTADCGVGRTGIFGIGARVAAMGSAEEVAEDGASAGRMGEAAMAPEGAEAIAVAGVGGETADALWCDEGAVSSALDMTVAGRRCRWCSV